MEIEKEGKKEKKKSSFFCCFSPNCGKNNPKRKKSGVGQNTASTDLNKTNISIKKNILKPSVKEFSLSKNKEHIDNDQSKNISKNGNIEINTYSNNNDNNNNSSQKKIITSNNNTNKINTFIKPNNNINLSSLTKNSEKKNKSINDYNTNKIKNINAIFNINSINIDKSNMINETNKTYKMNNNNQNISYNEDSVRKKVIEESKRKEINNECIIYDLTSNDDGIDNVNIYSNVRISNNVNNSCDDETDKKREKKKLNATNESYKLNHNFKNNYYPTDFNLNLSSEMKNNKPLNSEININPKLNLSNLNLNNNITTGEIQSKGEKNPIGTGGIMEISDKEINPTNKPIKIKYKLNISKSLNLFKIRNNYLSNSFLSDINLNNRSGIFFISENNLNNSDNNLD